MESEINRFATAYIDFYRDKHVWNDEMVLVERDRSSSEWVIYEMPELNQKDPDLLWNIILEILRRSPSEDVIEVLAAGPMEEYLVLHGEKSIDRLEEESNRNDALRDLLGGVWKSNMDENVWKKICELRSSEW